MIHSIWVINKAGGLVFSRSYTGTSHTPHLLSPLIHLLQPNSHPSASTSQVAVRVQAAELH